MERLRESQHAKEESSNKSVKATRPRSEPFDAAARLIYAGGVFRPTTHASGRPISAIRTAAHGAPRAALLEDFIFVKSSFTSITNASPNAWCTRAVLAHTAISRTTSRSRT